MAAPEHPVTPTHTAPVSRPHHALEPTANVSMTTRQKVRLTAEYPVVYSVESGDCTLDVVNAQSADIVASDKPGESRIAVKALDEADDHLPGLVRVHVILPATVLVIEAPVNK